jgi:hypothetical protein
MVPYLSFYVFKNSQFFTQNLLVLAYSFTENSQFGAKTDRISVFLGRGPPYCESVIHNGLIYEF